MTLTEAQRTARAESWDSYLSTYGKFVQAGERNAFDFAFTAGLDYAKQEQADNISESRWQAEIERVRVELDNGLVLRRRLGRLINNWRKEAARNYYRVYNPGGASSLNNAATALESVLVGWKFDEKR